MRIHIAQEEIVYYRAYQQTKSKSCSSYFADTISAAPRFNRYHCTGFKSESHPRDRLLPESIPVPAYNLVLRILLEYSQQILPCSGM
jgi:hypothetical protein